MLGYVGTHRGEYDVSAALVANSLRAVLHAGYESVSRLLGNAVAVMVGQPEVLTACARVPVAAAVDEFVLYDPPLKTSTVLLWFGPAALVLAGGIVVLVLLRRRARPAGEIAATADTGDDW